MRSKPFSIHCAISFSSKFHNLTRCSFWDTWYLHSCRIWNDCKCTIPTGCLTTVKLTFIFGWNPFLILQQVGVIFSKYFSSSLYWRTTIFNQHVTICTWNRQLHFLSIARSSLLVYVQYIAASQNVTSLMQSTSGWAVQNYWFSRTLQTITQYQTVTSFKSDRI